MKKMVPHEYELTKTECPGGKYMLVNWQAILFKSPSVISVTSELPIGALVQFFEPRVRRGLLSNALGVARFVGFKSHLLLSWQILFGQLGIGTTTTSQI